MKVFFFLFFTFMLSMIILPQIAFAHCPLCSAATGMAVAATRAYGLDDLIVGLFVGSFVVSTALWMNNFALKRKKGKEYLPNQKAILIIFSLMTMLVTFYFAGLLDMKYRIFGIDKIFFGTIAGTLMTLFSFQMHKKLRH